MDVVLISFLKVVDIALFMYMSAILISVILTWLVHFDVINTRNQFVYIVGNFLHKVTEPVLGRIRRFLPDLGGIDISPIIVFLIIMFMRNVVQGWIFAI